MGGLQMSWQPSLLSHKRKTGPPLGLRNLGNSCYLNSVLQCLTYTPPLANFCLRSLHSSLCDSSSSNGERKRECPFCILEKRISRSLSLDLTLDAPAKIQSCLKIFAEHFRHGRQEDAHEFLRYVIDACHNTCLRLKKLRRKSGGDSANGNSVVKEIFGGALQSQVKCLNCNSESNKVDEIMDISLDVLHCHSLKEALHKFFQPEVLDGTNKYKCENCKKLVAARKQMSILQAPNILVIQLKRFEGIFGGKIDTAIAFEEVLVLSSFMCKASQDPKPEYNLFGTIVHSGYSQESGHYYAYIKDASDRWYCCNDSYVKLSTLQDVLSEKVYILFFSRTDQRPASANTTFASNGVKSHDLNGNVESKNQKAAIPQKPVAIKPYAELSLQKDISTISKIDKVPSGSRVKFNILGNSGSKRFPPTIDGKIDKVQNLETNGKVKESALMQKIEKDMPSTTNRNVPCKDIAEMRQVFAAASENGQTLNGAIIENPQSFDGNGTTSKVRGPGMSGSKRKLQGSCILFAEDSQSRAKVERLKEELKQEACSVLRSCGWSDKVYSFMCSGKRICAQEAGNMRSGNELKKKLITEAKLTFISQIPESLKEDLVKRLQSLSREK